MPGENCSSHRLPHLRAGADAVASGNTPAINAIDVIKIGRSRSLAASTEASSAERPSMILMVPGKLHNQDGVLCSQAKQHHEPDLCQDVDWHGAQAQAR